MNVEIASAASDKTDSGKKSTGNTVVNERSESQEDVDSSEEDVAKI